MCYGWPLHVDPRRFVAIAVHGDGGRTNFFATVQVPFSRHGDVFPKINPATGEEDAQILSAGPRGVDDAVHAARRGANSRRYMM
jgi:hypothetical protein